LIINEPRRLAEREEVLGELHNFRITEIGLIATIGKITVSLPIELANSLTGLEGQRVGILRLDGYHVRRFDRKMHDNRSTSVRMNLSPQSVRIRE
jgi:hypothetical protein